MSLDLGLDLAKFHRTFVQVSVFKFVGRAPPDVRPFLHTFWERNAAQIFTCYFVTALQCLFVVDWRFVVGAFAEEVIALQPQSKLSNSLTSPQRHCQIFPGPHGAVLRRASKGRLG